MKLQRKVALIVIVAVLLLGFGVRYVLAVGSDLKEAASEIKMAQTMLQKTSSDYQTMMNKWQTTKSNSKGDLRDMGPVMELQAAVVKDLMQANQHTLNAVEVIEKHFNQ